MKKTCLYVLMISALLALIALWVATIRGMTSEDVSAAEQVAEANTLPESSETTENAAKKQQAASATEAPITTEKATEPVTEATEAVTETDNKSESVGKMVFNSERKTAERTAVTTEEINGEINEDGYGWVQLQYSAPYNICENHLTHDNGSITVYGHRETWYSTKEAAGQATAVDIPGKHVADDGTIRDEDGYICVASSDHDFYTIVMTSVGPGKVYDTVCGHGTIDVYTNW
ncbi:MAG: hypothetical protein IJM27_01550 [Eubacterium sp.]|nr:hypothetical protein [Eubacterium sp.]